MKRMRTNVLAIILSGAVTTLAVSDAMAQTQNSRSTYFLEGSTYRHELNPAFMGERGYVSFPGLVRSYSIPVFKVPSLRPTLRAKANPAY